MQNVKPTKFAETGTGSGQYISRVRLNTTNHPQTTTDQMFQALKHHRPNSVYIT